MKLIRDKSVRVHMVGTITIADIRKKFNLPDDAVLTIELPFVDYDNCGGTFTLDKDVQIDVKVERVK